MRVAYVDTSCLVAIAARERDAAALARTLSRFDPLVSSNLLEAELKAVLRREKISDDPGPLLDAITWIHPDRRLAPEIGRALEHGHLRGADLWHVACALYLAGDHPADLTFATLDTSQRAVASSLGFGLP
ncbi:MAG: PIN domain-containing protein [Thermoanaerobaculia bacterium]